MVLFDKSGNRFLDTVLLPGFLLAMAAGLLVLSSIIVLSLYNESALNQVSGAWIAIAMDLRDGIFYRPLFDESIGYGGTRFFPLFFSLIAAVSSVIESPVVSGHIVAVLSGLLLLMSCYLFMLRTGVKPLFSLALCVLLLAASSIQHGFEAVRGDILPLALNILGLAIYLNKGLGRKALYIAILCFVLAFSAKVTAIHGAASLLIWLILNGKKQEAGKVLLLTFLGYITFLGLLYAGTSGRVFDIFAACASGGASIYTLLKAPLNFSVSLSQNDQASLLLLFWAIFLFFNRFNKGGVSLPTVYFFISIMLTVLLYGSPGVSYNHLVDVAAASVLFIAYAGFSTNSSNATASAGVYIVLVVFVISMSLSMVREGLDEYRSPSQLFPEQLVSLVKDSEGVILSENTVLPVYSGQKPYLLDPFMLRLVMQQDAEIRASVISDIASRKYSAIIFMRDPVIDTDWYSDVHFGDAFMNKVFEYYKESEKFGRYVVYRPI